MFTDPSQDIMSLSYLVSTAGHAQAQNDVYPHTIQSINQLIREGAQELGDRTVVGFAVPDAAGNDGWGCERYSYKDLVRLSQTYADILQNHLKLRPTSKSNPSTSSPSASSSHTPSTPDPTNEAQSPNQAAKEGGNQVVSLLCPTGLDFLVAWVACMGLGLGVVFVAPQCSPSAVAHLLGSTGSTHLLYHPKYTDLAESSRSLSPSTPLIQLPNLPSLSSSKSFDPSWPPNPIDPNHTSHIFHTSGTSGTPKPIPHFHLPEVLCLPRRPLGHPDTLQAAFTTTPLFHGGVSDLLRGWMARSTVLFYPSSTSAITSKSIVDSVKACQPLADDSKESPITSFLSVPYILTLLSPASDSKDSHGATKLLASMEIVSTGGAPLDTAVGDGLVQAGVKLVSRLGSSECGFLLTSYRDFDNDHEWEWLHNDSPYASALVFEPTSDGGGNKAEMVVTNEWKSKVKSNRPDGSYATGDIYEKHASKPNVWRYAGRGDDVLVMSNGEKMSPGPIEIVLRSSPLIADALVVGSNRPQVGCLLFPTDFPPPSDLVQQLSDLLKQANEQSPSHAQLGSEMCHVVAQPERAAMLPKSSKGTIQRGVAYDTYTSEIDTMYGDGDGGHRLTIAGRELEDWLLAKVGDIIGDSKRYKDDVLETDTDLFSWGVDSVKAARLRFAMMKELDLGGQSLPMNVVFEYSTVERLAKLCESMQQGREAVTQTTNDQHQRMRELVDKYTDFANFKMHPTSNGAITTAGKTIVLTGATGSLGSHLLAQLSQLPPSQVERVTCLVRGETVEAARERIRKALSFRGLEAAPERYDVLPARLGRPDLGLNTDVFSQLLEQTDFVIHAAWAVHFGSGLDSFENDHIQGTRHLLDLVATSRKQARLFFCSSLASVLNTGSSEQTIEEAISKDPSTAIPIGYSQSKWVTEAICAQAAQSSVLQDRVHILRIGQLCGDVERGMWNESEGWPLMLRTAKVTGKLPLLREDPSWLPVDIAARAVLEITMTSESRSTVAHVANPRLNRWQDILDDLRAAGLDFEAVEANQWVEAMARSGGDETTNPSKKMLAMWQSAYAGEEGNKPAAPVSTAKATRLSKSLAGCTPVSSELIAKMVARWKESGFVPN